MKLNNLSRDVVVVADDFTGANDAGVSLALCGKKVSVAFQTPFTELTDALVLNTDSRALPASEAADKIAALGAEIGEARWLIKKIDSTLRGNVGVETQALKTLSGKQQVIVAPAYPAAGRITLHGKCLVNGIPVNETEFASDPKTPVPSADIADLFTGFKGRVVTVNALEAALAQGTEWLIVDAQTDEALDAIIAAALTCAQMPLLVGSAGLCDALARHLAPVRRKQVLAVVGSMSEIAQRQVALAVREPSASSVFVDVNDVLKGSMADCLAQITQALSAGNHCIVHTCADRDARHHVEQLCLRHQMTRAELGETLCTFLGELTRQALDACAPDALYVSGGDVAMAVANALHAQGFEITGRVARCVPYGKFLGCAWLRPVMTKAGGFGTEETLREVLHFIEERVSD
ncbi:four-carbon acid sugar kinase family protein [Enterobacter sp. UNJFSC 003]|uniref:D-threonate kinase n=1 Tax=Enterobacter sp. UNJFSC 003 TaxID=3122077 RepID=UPI002EABBB84|nr:four-carbon acid sugar kinase family protein [Serratia liquefaciens]